MRRAAVLAGIVCLGILTMAVTGPDARQNVAEIEQVEDNLYVIKGGGGNTAAFVTEQGVVVVDTKLAGWGDAILDKIRSVTDKPITMIINTHTHGDHVGSNAELAPTVEVVAHENTKANMEKMDAFEGAQARFLPGRTYSDRLSLLGGDDRIDLFYFGRGHTNGDTVIVFPSLRVAHTGDLFPGPQVPFLDMNNGGSGVAYPETIAKVIAGVSGVDKVIPGHDDVTDWQALEDFGDFMRDFVAAVEQAAEGGTSAADAGKSLELPARYEHYNRRRLEASVESLYAELGH